MFLKPDVHCSEVTKSILRGFKNVLTLVRLARSTFFYPRYVGTLQRENLPSFFGVRKSHGSFICSGSRIQSCRLIALEMALEKKLSKRASHFTIVDGSLKTIKAQGLKKGLFRDVLEQGAESFMG